MKRFLSERKLNNEGGKAALKGGIAGGSRFSAAENGSVARSMLLRRVSACVLALALLFAISDMIGTGPGLYDALPAVIVSAFLFLLEKKVGRGPALICCAAVLCAAASACFAFGQLRYGSAIYAQRVFDASEAVNRYVYIKLNAESAGYSASSALNTFRAVLSACIASLLYVLSLAPSRFVLPAAAFGMAAVFCGFFGLSPSPLYAYGFGLVLLLSLILNSEGHLGRIAKGGAVAGYVALCLILQFAAGGVDEALEARSEDVRDRLSQTYAVTGTQPEQLPEVENLTHKESRLNEAEASGEDSSSRPDEFQKNTEYEQEISRPNQTDWFRVFYMLLLSVLLVIMPFGIIFLVVRAQRKASAYREAFSSGDSRVAVKALFRHIADLMKASGIGDGNSNYSDLEKALEGDDSVFGDGFTEKFRRALFDWQEAIYSVHEVPQEEKSFLQGLSDEAERMLYEASDRRKRFRLRFIDCLVSEDALKSVSGTN